MSLESTRLPDELADQLMELRTWVRWQWILRGVGRIGLIAAVGFAAALLADWKYDLSPGTRLAAICGISGGVLFAAVGWLVIPLCRRMRWTELAAMADQAHPEWDGSLTSSVELCGDKEAVGFAGSPVMRQLMLEQTKQQVDQLDPEEVVSSRSAWNAVRAGLVAAVILFAPVFIAPSTYRQLWGRLLTPNDNWGTAGAWQIDVTDGDRVVARGADVELLATAKRDDVADPPKTLMLEWRDAAGTADRRAMPFDEARKAFVTLVPHVMRDVQFRVVAEKQKSREYRIQVVEPPVVTKIKLDVEPPAYCGWPAQSLDGAVGSIRVFEQSKLKFALEFNKPVETPALAWQHGAEPAALQLSDDRRTATLEFAADPKQAGPFSFAVADEHKLKNNDIAPRELLIATDELPKLAVKGDHSSEVRPDDVVPIDVTASDDIGIGNLELHLTISDIEQPLQLADNVQGQKLAEHRFTLDLNSLKLTHGDLLVYKVRLTDEQPPPGPHEVWSPPRVLRINRKAAPPGANDLAKSHEQLRDELQDLQRDARDRSNELEQFQKELEKTRRDKDVPDKERFDTLTEKLATLTERGEKLAEQLARDPLFNDLADKVRDVSKQELERAEKEVAAARDEKTIEQNRDLRQARKDLEEAAKKLGELDKPFQQLADLQKDLLELKRLARQAEQLAQRADELAQAEQAKETNDQRADANQPEASARENAPQTADPTKPDASKSESPEAAVERQRLADQQKQLAEALADLLKRRPELLNAAKRDQLEQLEKLADEARQLAEQQQQLADALKDQQQAAADKATQLAEKQRDLLARAEQVAETSNTAEVTRSVSEGERPKANDAKDQKDEKNSAEPKPKEGNEQPSDPPKAANSADTPQPLNRDALKAAAEALQQGDLAEALKQQQQAANELDRLAADLEQAKADLAQSKSDQADAQQKALADAARKLADQQAKLAEKSTEAAKSNSADEKQKAADQLAADQAKLNDQIAALPKPEAAQLNNSNAAGDPAKGNQPQNSDNKPADSSDKPVANDKPAANAEPSRSERAETARNEAMQRAEQSAQALKDGNLAQAAQQQQQAAQALNELAKQAAAQPNANPPNNVDQPNVDQSKGDKPNPDSSDANPQPNPPQSDKDPPNINPAGNEQPMPTDPQAQQLAQLAVEQRQLAQEVARAIQEQRGEPANPNQPPNGDMPQSQPNAQQPNGDSPPMQNSGDQPQQPQGNTNEKISVAQQAREALAAQRELAQQAKQLDEQVRQDAPVDAQEPQQSREAAEQAQAAAKQANAGQLKQAADSGHEAAEAAQQLADNLAQNPKADPKLSQQAADLAERQNEVADAMRNLAEQQPAAAAAQQQRQQELNDATKQLGEQLTQSQERLGQQPLNQQKAASRAEQAAQQTDEAQQAMQSAKQNSEQANSNQAAQSAQQAAESLQQAAEQAQAASKQDKPVSTPLPRGLGKEVADAAEALRQAQQAGQQGEGQKGQQGQKGPSGEGQQGQGQQPGQSGSPMPGQPSSTDAPQQTAPKLNSPLAQMAERLREAAKSLQQAANQAAPQMASRDGQPQPNGQPGQPNPSNNPNGQPNGAGASGQGNQTPGNDSGLPVELADQLKKLTGREWGKLSSKLKTELLQGAKSQAHGDYNKLIKLYFEEIAKTQTEPNAGAKP